MKLYPWDDVVKEAEAHIGRGAQVLQQFNCSHCGAKQTMDVANVFYMSGKCQECGKITNIKKRGHNYMLMIGVR